MAASSVGKALRGVRRGDVVRTFAERPNPCLRVLDVRHGQIAEVTASTDDVARAA
jgi:hypothetical protein